MIEEQTQIEDFSAIRLKLASAEEIRSWSHGEVLKPETINYRTQKPEKSGLFAEEIFGPSKDWECYCGKYKRIRYKGIVCDKCGVEVTRSLVRRERMGHIDLAVPVSHIWFLRGVPSKIGLILDLSVQSLEKVIYFANYIITDVNEELREETLKQIDKEAEAKRKSIDSSSNKILNEVKLKKNKMLEGTKSAEEGKKIEKDIEVELENSYLQKAERLKNLEETVNFAKKELKNLASLQIVSESTFQDLSLKYGHVFEAGIGAEAIRKLLNRIDLMTMIKELEEETKKSPKNKKRRLIRRLKLLKNLKANKIKPESMILTVIPVIPPDLRPMVQLDGGRFAASDLNDLYRRVINRNNRLKKLIELNAPEIICRNEKRMLQEAVDALIDNSARHGKTVTASTGQKRQLKSLADMLKGKQGRFRQNLLGKRVDYSGRSVIVVGPHLKIFQCGIPKTMALELFKPFVISRLIKEEYVHNVRSANRFIEMGQGEVWDILEEVTKNSHILLNRAPTLHRLGIQAFQPILIEGKAIQIHPLVCTPFNADFDGDQMAAHVPLTEEAKREAAEIMLSSRNLLKPATGLPATTPSQDIVLGCYYLTSINEEIKPEQIKSFSSPEEALMSYHLGFLGIRDKIKIKIDNQVIETSTGRIIFNSVLPKELGFINEVMERKNLSQIVSQVLARLGIDKAVLFLDKLKEVSLEYLTRSGLSWGMADLQVPKEKPALIKEAEKKLDEVQTHYEAGLLTKEERHGKVIDIWAEVKNKITNFSRGALNKKGSVSAIIESGARGSWSQITQMMGMKGLVTNPAGETIELPVKGSFKEGFDVLEYFISTHGARKGLTDTALRTANAGYLTRRLVDVSQDIVIVTEDCKNNEGTEITREESEEAGKTLEQRFLGRVVLESIIDPKSKKVLVKSGELVTEEHLEKIKKINLQKIKIRSILNCKAHRGICQKCYGYDLGYNRPVQLGTAVGIIAAQSIGEPGTQLTMRTFHTGGIAEKDITQGLPRVEELFEARPIKKAALIAESQGVVEKIEGEKQKIIKIKSPKIEAAYPYDKKYTLKVKNGDKVKKGDLLAVAKEAKLISEHQGKIKLTANKIIVKDENEIIKEYIVSSGLAILVKEGDKVEKGDFLTDGNINLQELYQFKGRLATQKYVMKEIQYIYSSQGQELNDKHVEVIVRQMFSRYYIRDAGDTDLLSGEVVTSDQITEANNSLLKGKKRLIRADRLLLGITKVSLSTDSFLSAASFQETARVLIDAAVSGRVDNLRGLKENVIIGKLIPVGTGYNK